jgi:hypothetical protein
MLLLGWTGGGNQTLSVWDEFHLALTTAISSTSARAYTRKNTGKHPAILGLPFVGQREQGDKANGGNSFCPQHTCITYDTHSRKLTPSAICRLFCSFNVRAMQTFGTKGMCSRILDSWHAELNLQNNSEVWLFLPSTRLFYSFNVRATQTLESTVCEAESWASDRVE